MYTSLTGVILMASPDVAEDDRFFIHSGPLPGVSYPLDILYCDECDGWPLEYTEHHPNYEGAKKWMEKNLTDEMRALYLGETPSGEKGKSSEGGEEGAGEEGKKRQKRGGKGVIKPKKKTQEPQGVQLSRASRGKRKFVTVVTGLASYGIDLKVASKFFGSRFACGSSVTGDDEIVIQGDVKDDLFDIIPEKWSMIDEDSIDDLGDQKRS